MMKDLLQRYVEGNVSEEEIETVVDWLNEDDKNVDEFMALSKLYHISLFNNPDAQQTIEEESSRIPFRKIAYEILKIAAIFLIIWGGLQFLHKTEKAPLQYQTLFVPAGQRAELILSDSSKVWLNSLSRITYATDFNTENRIVELDGEAYFDVSHDSDRPFIVKTGNMDIKVLGTEFNVKAYSDDPGSEVSLLRGSVELLPAGSNQIYKMKENEKVSILNSKVRSADSTNEKTKNETQKLQVEKIYVSQIKNFDYFEWINGLICFDDEPFEVIISKLSIYYDVKIIDQNNSFKKKRYTGKFRSKDGIEHVLKVLQLKEKFRFDKNEITNTIIIK